MTAADQIVRSAKKCLPWGRPHMTRTTQPHGAQPDRHHIAIEDRRKTILGKQRDLFGLPGAFIEDLDRLAPRGFLIVVDLSKIQYLPLNHAAIMNAPIFDNRPCPMVLAVLAANSGAQKHDADLRFDHGPARHLVGTTGVCADLDPSNPMTCRDQTPRKSQISRSVGKVALGKRVSPDPFGDCAAVEPRLSHNIADGSSFPTQRADPIKERLP